jgi:hypothetical protein
MTLVSDAIFSTVREIGLGLVDLKNLGAIIFPFRDRFGGPICRLSIPPTESRSNGRRRLRFGSCGNFRMNLAAPTIIYVIFQMNQGN